MSYRLLLYLNYNQKKLIQHRREYSSLSPIWFSESPNTAPIVFNTAPTVPNTAPTVPNRKTYLLCFVHVSKAILKAIRRWKLVNFFSTRDGKEPTICPSATYILFLINSISSIHFFQTIAYYLSDDFLKGMLFKLSQTVEGEISNIPPTDHSFEPICMKFLLGVVVKHTI